MYLSKSKMTPKNEISPKKKYFAINFVRLIHKLCQILSALPIGATLSIFTVSAFVFLTLAPNIPILFIAIPERIISLIHCSGYTALPKTLHGHFW